MTVKIYVRDEQFRRLGEIDDWQSLSIQKIFNDVGRWTLDLDADTWGASALTEAHGIAITYNGRPLISGPVDLPKRSFADGSNRLSITGPDDNIWISDRQTWPCTPDYTQANVFPDNANDVRPGAASDVMNGFVAANCLSSGWDPERAIQGLTIPNASGSIGANITVQARFDMLKDLLNSAALSGGGLGWEVTQQGSQLVFEVYAPADISSTVRFSTGLGNLSKFTYSHQRPQFNWCIVAGQGQGIDRVFVTAQDDESIATWGRIEGPLIDRRDTNDEAQLAQSATEALAKAADVLSIECTVTDTENIEFWNQWGLGSRVAVTLDGVTYTDTVREVDATWQNADTPMVISPLIGSPQARRPAVPALFAKQRENALRVSQLQTRV